MSWPDGGVMGEYGMGVLAEELRTGVADKAHRLYGTRAQSESELHYHAAAMKALEAAIDLLWMAEPGFALTLGKKSASDREIRIRATLTRSLEGLFLACTRRREERSGE